MKVEILATFKRAYVYKITESSDDKVFYQILEEINLQLKRKKLPCPTYTELHSITLDIFHDKANRSQKKNTKIELPAFYIKAEFDFNLTKIYSFDKAESGSEMFEQTIKNSIVDNKSVYFRFVYSYFIELLLIGQIAAPGLFYIKVGDIKIDGIPQININPGFDCIYDEIHLMNYSFYKKLDVLSYSELICWFEANNIWFGRNSKNDYSKALNDLYYYYNSNESESRLIYSLRILERFYAKNKNDTRKQLKMNIPKLLGEVLSIDDLIEDMMKLRNDFMHGNTDVMPHNYIKMNSGEFLDPNFHHWQAEVIGNYLVINTLQSLYKVNNVNFINEP